MHREHEESVNCSYSFCGGVPGKDRYKLVSSADLSTEQLVIAAYISILLGFMSIIPRSADSITLSKTTDARSEILSLLPTSSFYSIGKTLTAFISFQRLVSDLFYLNGAILTYFMVRPAF